MIKKEKGFTIIEVIVSIGIISIIGSAALASTFQVINVTDRSKGHVNAVRSAQEAGYWISRDAQMTGTVTTDDLGAGEFLVFTWTEAGLASDGTHHTITYYLEDVENNIGTLKRRHQSSLGMDSTMRIADSIYVNPGDPTLTSQANYTRPVFELQITAISGKSTETREYKINCRSSM